MYNLPPIVQVSTDTVIAISGWSGWLLAALSLALGAAMLLVFGKTSNQEAIRSTKRLLWAHLLELRLYSDEPLMVWKAHTGLLSANVKYLALMLKPVVIMTVPMLLLFPHFEAFFGIAPLPPGSTANLTVQMKKTMQPADAPPQLQPPANVAVETPGVRSPSDNQVTWRIRALQPGSGVMKIVLPDGTVEKKIVTGVGPGYISGRRVGSFAEMFLYPGETPFSSASLDWVEVSHPPAEVRWLGFQLHWLIWLLLLSMISALLLKSRMKVSF